MQRRNKTKLLSLLGWLALAGCGGGGGGGSSALPTAPDAATPPPAQPAITLAPVRTITDGTPLGKYQWPEGVHPSGGVGQPVASLPCAAPAARYDYAHLSLFVNGEQVAVPVNIGSVGPTLAQQAGCTYSLRTDDWSGKIRFDDAATTPFTLGQLFAIWGQPLSATNLAGVTGLPVVAYINNDGVLAKYTGDLTALPLKPRSEITLLAGALPQQVPTYAWSDPPPLSPTPVSLGASNTVAYWPDGATPSGGVGAPVDGLPCTVGLSENFHIHARVAIIRDGVQLALPAMIGLPTTANGCIYALHTHDRTGQVHLEGDQVTRFTVGNLFKMWGQPLSSTNVAGISDKPIAVFIHDGGNVRRYLGNPADIELLSKRVVTFQIGTPLTTIPTYTWDSGR